MPHTLVCALASKYNKYSVEPLAARVTLRQFALAVHEDDGVADACVSLQDRFDLDVNVLLLAAYVGAVRRQTVTAEQLAAARALIDSWRDEVVRPLRGVRRRLKTGPAPAPNPQTDEMRGKVAKAEIAAELIELEVLGSWVEGLDGPPGPQSSAELVTAGMEVAVRAYSTEPLTDDDRRALTLISAAAARHSDTNSAG